MKKLFCISLFILFFSNLKSQIIPDSVNKFIKEWIDVPYKFGGTTKRGIDCSKLTQNFYKYVLNDTLPRVTWQQWQVTKRVSKDSLQMGDLVFFKSRKSPSGWHVGIYLADNLFFHAANRRDGVKVSSLEESYYRSTFKGGGRL